MGKLEGKVAFITGAARGQGRSHAIRLASEGADIIAVDICAQIDSVPYPLSSPADLATTVASVKAFGRQIVAVEADIRDFSQLSEAFSAGISEFGHVDIVLANAGIGPLSIHHRIQEWQDVLDVNLTGTYNTIRLAAPVMVEQGSGGAIVLTSSTAGLTGYGGDSPGVLGYVASKHGIVGLMRSYANFLAPHQIRVNSRQCPARVDDRSIRRVGRRRLARLGRRALRHRHRPSRRRRIHQQKVVLDRGQMSSAVMPSSSASSGSEARRRRWMSMILA
jgi:NAD(P)-dependent dehydrogenase (short-subunit alcohol dehydrogenase family)